MSRSPDPWGTRARELWEALEPIHSCAYYSAATTAAMADAGLRGWQGYLAFRAAPLGPVSAAEVTAAFYNFAPAMIDRHLHGAWSIVSPDDAWELRVRAARQTLEGLLGRDDPTAVSEAVELAEAAVEAAPWPGRRFAAAHLRLNPPTDPLSRLWFAVTVLREHRGDGHVAALLAHGVSGLGAHVLQAAAGRIAEDVVTTRRGWAVEEWAAQVQELRRQNLLDERCRLTNPGQELKRSIEDATDRAGADPYRGLGPAGSQRLLDLGRRLGGQVLAAGGLPAVNALGLPPRGQG